jgi:hypothetical protein
LIYEFRSSTPIDVPVFVGVACSTMTDTLRPADTAVPEALEHGHAKLNRSIGVVGGTLLTLSCVTPASTLFVVVPDLFGRSAPPPP